MDLRPPLTPALDAFGLPATVELPDRSTVKTVAFWLPPMTVDLPPGIDIRRADPKHVIVLPLSDVSQIPKGAVVTIADQAGGKTSQWTVDSSMRIDHDHHRAVVTPVVDR